MGDVILLLNHVGDPDKYELGCYVGLTCVWEGDLLTINPCPKFYFFTLSSFISTTELFYYYDMFCDSLPPNSRIIHKEGMV